MPPMKLAHLPTRDYAGNKKKLEEVVAILEAGHALPFAVQPAAVDLPELQVGVFCSLVCNGYCPAMTHAAWPSMRLASLAVVRVL